MTRGELRRGELEWRATRHSFNPQWRKPQHLTLWERLVRWLNAP